MLRIITEGLSFPLRLWLQPVAFALWVFSFIPSDLGPNFSLIGAFKRFNEPSIRRSVSGLLLRLPSAFL